MAQRGLTQGYPRAGGAAAARRSPAADRTPSADYPHRRDRRTPRSSSARRRCPRTTRLPRHRSCPVELRRRHRAAEIDHPAPGPGTGAGLPRHAVVVGERESDIHGLLKHQAEHASEAGLVVRACTGRQRRVRSGTRSCERRCCGRSNRSRISRSRS